MEMKGFFAEFTYELNLESIALHFYPVSVMHLWNPFFVEYGREVQ